MKRFVSTLYIACALCTSVMAVTVSDVAGTFSGSLNIGGTPYPDKEVYILPGAENNTVTFVLPDFMYGAASLGNIVLVNIPMDTNGQLSMNGKSLYIKAIMERAAVSVLSGSSVSSSSATMLLSIEVATLPEPLSVTFNGAKTNKNYDFTNGGFEGNWTNNEPKGWHSFPSATGSMASFVSGNTGQFTQSTDIRPGSTGSHSARLQSTSMFGVKANGNCTNGQINAGSMSASDGSKNYNMSDPSNSAYTTPFVGAPDSLVFWAKYIPADQNPSNSSNKARAHAVITTNARYQDPESSDYSSVKIADAAVNYSATSSMGWQRIAVPFTYYSVSPDQAAYMLMTFTTNEQPGGGTTTSSSVDNIYLDDVEMIYNYRLSSFKIDGVGVEFTNGKAALSKEFSDSDYQLEAKTNGKAARTFIGYDAESYKVYVYVLPDNYAQAKKYTVYTIQMEEPETRPDATYYNYTGHTCVGQPYSDELFQNLTEEGQYQTVIPNSHGGDSVITMELVIDPTYLFDTQEYITDEDVVEWRGQVISGLAYADEPYIYYDSLLTVGGCDSVYRLQVYVTTVPRTYGAYTASACVGDSVEFEGVYYSEPYEGDILISQLNQYGGDSVVHLTVQFTPLYIFTTNMTIREGENKTWEGVQLGTLPAGSITMNASYYTVDGCDSIRMLNLTVLPISKPWTGTDTVSVSTVCGRYDGELNIGGTRYADKSMFVLPGTVDSTVTLVLPDFSFNGGKLGHVVLPNIPMSANGQLMLDNRTLYMDSISERATVTLINGHKEGAVTYYSVLANEKAQMVLYIETPSLPEAILVFFQGDAVRHNNYAVHNGGFEGAWTTEPDGWHSFATATGEMADFVSSNTQQFVLSNDVRPGSNGTQSAMISSSIILSVKANGNCTNGQIHAGSMTADNPAGNYNFSDPTNNGFNTPFNGRPDSLIFWTKYLPADRDAGNVLNKARMNTIITTNARYQDPQAETDYTNVKIGAATVNYTAADMNWQRIAVPFTYSSATAGLKPAYILTTFTTNEQPGGGTSYTTSGSNRVNVLDTVYLDDVEVVYNKRLRAFYHEAEEVEFEQYVAHVNDTYCDDCASYEAYGNGVSALSFIAFDGEHRCITVYVVADDYAQTLDYMLYRVEFEDSQTAELQPINPSQDVETVRTLNDTYEKVLYNGQLFIRQGDNWYTISGLKINKR